MKVTFVHFLQHVLKVHNLTRAQLTYCRVAFDRIDPGSLDGEARELARKIFGDIDAIPAAARHVVCTLKGARIGGTWLHSLFLLYAALTANLNGLATGEQGFAIIVAPDLRLARQALRYAAGAAKECASIASCIESDGSDSLVVRRPQDGKVVAIECLPATRGGSAVRGRTLVAALLDEASFFRDDSAVVNAGEIFRAVVMRILPGGLLSMISTVWAEGDLLTEKVNANHGNPTSCIAAKAPTLLMRDDARIRQVVAEEYERDAPNAAREFDLIPFPAGAGLFFGGNTITDAIDHGLPDVIMYSNAVENVGAGVDTGLVNDSSAAVIVHKIEDAFTLAELAELRPQPGRPLKLSEVCATYADVLRRHELFEALADHHELEPSKEHLEPHHVSLEAGPAGNVGKFETYAYARTLFNEGKIRIPAGHTRLIRQLREVCSRPMAGGSLKIWSPRRGGHGDLVSAFVLALWHAGKESNSMMAALRASLNREKRTGIPWADEWSAPAAPSRLGWPNY